MNPRKEKEKFVASPKVPKKVWGMATPQGERKRRKKKGSTLPLPMLSNKKREEGGNDRSAGGLQWRMKPGPGNCLMLGGEEERPPFNLLMGGVTSSMPACQKQKGVRRGDGE